MMSPGYDLEVQIVREGYDRQAFWAQTRAAVIPATGGAVMTTQKAAQGGSDIFFAVHSLRSGDGGRTWSEPVPQDGLGRMELADGRTTCPCDGSPAWHAASGKVLATGHLAVYAGDHLSKPPYPRQTWYSVYDVQSGSWGEQRFLAMPDEEKFFNCGAGCTQRVDLPNGDVLLPVYFRSRSEEEAGAPKCHRATVVRCRFDGESLTYVSHGDELTCAEPRGFCEPSLASFGGRYFLTLRNDVRGYVARGNDGQAFEAPVPWRFDDGEELGNYNTQQHWVTHSDALYLVYTRRGVNNDHVFRHRAPLLMAQVDPDRLCIIRETERAVVPERGARLGNFGITVASRDETWVVVSEWMQTTGPNPYDGTVCERYGSTNAFFISHLKWRRPNELVTW